LIKGKDRKNLTFQDLREAVKKVFPKAEIEIRGIIEK
jgi:hypothetical protein